MNKVREIANNYSNKIKEHKNNIAKIIPHHKDELNIEDINEIFNALINQDSQYMSEDEFNGRISGSYRVNKYKEGNI